MRQKVLWWCMWGIGSVFWLVVIIQIVSANSETVIIQSDSTNVTNTLIHKPIASENTTSSPVDSVLHKDSKKPEFTPRDSAEKKDDVKDNNECINVNSANIDELVSLQGIGPVLAQRIVEFRRDNGNFKTESDLVKVKGIGQGKLKKIKDHICF